MPYAWDSPSPVPRPGALVVKNGSKIRSRTSGGIPPPVSLTSITSHSVAAGWPGSRPTSSRRRDRRKRSAPPSGIASRALTARLVNTCRSWLGSALTGNDPALGVERDADRGRQRALEQLDRLLHQAGQIQRLQRRRRLPAEVEDLPHQGGRPLALLDDQIQPSVHERRVAVAALGPARPSSRWSSGCC